MHNITTVLSIMDSAAINDKMYNGHNVIQMGLITHAISIDEKGPFK